MKNWNLFSFNKVFFVAFFTLVVLNSFAVIVRDDLGMQFIKVLSIPVFFIFFYARNNKINISLIVFLVLAFLSDGVRLLFHDFNIFCLESVFYSFAFMQLIVFMLPKFKFIQFDGLIKAYLLMMFGVVVFFANVLYDFVGIEFLNSMETMLFSTKCTVITALVFVTYGVYLHVQSKQSILFLIATVCFGFSCILDYLNFSFVNVWSFMILNRITYLLGIYFIFRFIIEENKLKTRQIEVDVQENFSSDNIFV
ncbi:hypothetical protein [uncultured Algibacter sp.]|uniref:hypothetical protein n=1 Tax=uncultured Algibacter sp. TaxID=298659 RepID=UPI00262711D4|nr:hypothetical protein [uncultured Algibacter sp.]